MIGRVLSHYQLVEKIGAGGMGEVYRARDLKLERDVAIKVLPAGLLGDEAARHRFRKEALALSKLNHPHIETIHEFDTQEGVDFLVMEYISGVNLDHKLAQGALPEKEVARLGAQLAEGLAAAHGQGLVHRDIKPGNLRLTPDGRLKILDFGLAGILQPAAETPPTESLTQTQAIRGTLPYMAPEQLRGERADTRSDIWAAGAVLYEMATGQLPFPESHAPRLIAAILHEVPTAPSAVNRRVSPALENIILKALDKEPERRYQAAKELQVDLERITTPVPVRTIPRARWSLPRWSLAAAVALAVLLALWVGTILRQTGPAPATPAGPRLSTGARPSANAEANEYFEKAMLAMAARFDLPHARQMLERALTIDPQFAAARAEYGFTYLLLIDSGSSNDTSVLYKAEEELRRTLQDDPTSARAHSALAAVYLYQGRKELMPQEAEKALALDPNNLDALNWLQNYHDLNGEHAAAEALARRMLELSPTFFPARMNLGEIRRELGDAAGAIREQEKVLEQDPQNIFALVYLGRTYLEAGDLRRARETLARIPTEQRGNFQARLAWAVLLAREGKRAEARKEMDEEVLKYGAVVPNLTAMLAQFYAGIGDEEKALDWLDRAVRGGDERLEWFLRDPLLGGIRDHPRFQQIADSITFRRQQRAQIARQP